MSPAEEHEEEIRQARERQKFYRNPRDARAANFTGTAAGGPMQLWPLTVMFMGLYIIYIYITS